MTRLAADAVASATIAEALPPGAYTLRLSLARPAFVRAELTFASVVLPLPLRPAEPGAPAGGLAAGAAADGRVPPLAGVAADGRVPPAAPTLCARFAVAEPVVAVRVLAVEPLRFVLAAARVAPAAPWSTLAPDWTVGPLALPPRQGGGMRTGAVRLPGCDPRVAVAGAEAVAIAGNELDCGECAVLRLAFDPPLAAGRWRIAGRFGSDGRPALVEPRLLRPGAETPMDSLAVLRRVADARYAADFVLAAPAETLLLRPRELPGRVEVGELAVRRLSPAAAALRAVRAGARVLSLPAWGRPRRHAPRSAADGPPVTVVTATRDAPRHLERFLSTLARTSHRPLDLVLVDNGTTDGAALRLLAAARKDGARVVEDPRRFNFSALCNRGAEGARGVLVFANNDIAFDDPGWLGALVAAAADPAVGIAGAKLLYPDGRVQHAGLVLAGEARVRHAERFLPAGRPGHLHRQRLTTEVSAVTGALMAIRADLFHALGGFDPRLGLLLNDADLCLRARACGLKNLLVPQSVAVHHESASIGPRRADLLSRGGPLWALERAEEARVFRERWGQLADADPCYPAGRDPLAADFRRRL